MTYTDEDAKSDDHTVPIEAPPSLRAARRAMPGILADQSETALSELPAGVLEHRRRNAENARARAERGRAASGGVALSQSALHVVQPLGAAPAWGRSLPRKARAVPSRAVSAPISAEVPGPVRSIKLWTAGMLFLLTALSLVAAVHLTLG